jgi:hypothetical protein
MGVSELKNCGKEAEKVIEPSREQDRRKKALLLGNDYSEADRIYSEYYNCLMEKCDPVERSIIRNLKWVIENYERCVAKIQISGFSIDECMKAYAEGDVC